ncbi:MAG: zinc-finger domain-containing protein [Pseudomonadota bacterium]
MSKVTTVAEDKESVGCNGGGGSLGHPLIYLRFENKKEIDCYYCGARFIKVDAEGITEDGQQRA